jgi:hypothetical protein
MLANLKNDCRAALFCAWNCCFGGITLVMGLVATAGMAIELVGATIKRAATAVGFTVCDCQFDIEAHEDAVYAGML